MNLLTLTLLCRSNQGSTSSYSRKVVPCFAVGRNMQNKAALRTPIRLRLRVLVVADVGRANEEMKRWPFTIWAACALILAAMIQWLKLGYDQNPVAAVLTVGQAVWAFMFWLPDELLFSFNGGRVVRFQEALSVLMGFGLCVGLDLTIRWAKACSRMNTDRTSNQDSHATSEPAPGATSSSREG